MGSERSRHYQGVKSNEANNVIKDAILLLISTMSESIITKNQGKQELLSAVENIEWQLAGLEADF